jgi:hypothetical protein
VYGLLGFAEPGSDFGGHFVAPYEGVGDRRADCDGERREVCEGYLPAKGLEAVSGGVEGAAECQLMGVSCWLLVEELTFGSPFCFALFESLIEELFLNLWRSGSSIR